MRNSLFYMLVSGLLLARLTACRPHPALEPYQTERFELSAAPAAAEGYPMEVVEGRFITSDGKSFPIAPEFLEGKWGLSAIGYVSGDGTAPAPDSLEVRWFSYPEDKFYEGHFLMPQRRIHSLLKEGYWEDGKHQTYGDLTVCILPKGVVVVWLAGQNQVLIGRYQGQEIEFDFKRFNEAANRGRMIAQERAKLPAHVQEEIRTNTLSTKQWDEYLKTYPWKVEFSRPLTLYDYALGYYSGEKTQYSKTKDLSLYVKDLLEPSRKAVPDGGSLKVRDKYGFKREIFIDSFDEPETLAAFRTLHAGSPAAPLVLYVDTDPRVRHVRLWLRSDRQQVELTQAKIELYDAK